MACGRFHDKSIYFTSPIITAVANYHAGLELGLITGVAHLIGGLMLSPDLDLRSTPYRRWGLLRWLWIPYQRLVPRHRHWLSHGVIVGSSLRLIYVVAWLSPLLLVFPLNQFYLNSVNIARASAVFAGVELSALNHLVLDGLIVPLPKSVKRALKGD